MVHRSHFYGAPQNALWCTIEFSMVHHFSCSTGARWVNELAIPLVSPAPWERGLARAQTGEGTVGDLCSAVHVGADGVYPMDSSAALTNRKGKPNGFPFEHGEVG